MELVVFVVGLFLFTAYFWLEARREEKLTHEEKKREVMKQKSPIFYWGLIFLYWTIIGVLMIKL